MVHEETFEEIKKVFDQAVQELELAGHVTLHKDYDFFVRVDVEYAYTCGAKRMPVNELIGRIAILPCMDAEGNEDAVADYFGKDREEEYEEDPDYPLEPEGVLFQLKDGFWTHTEEDDRLGEEQDAEALAEEERQIAEYEAEKHLKINAVLGDITQFEGDAIVNAANERMLGGGGVDGAIHRAAGPDLLAACEKVPEVSPGVRCPTGEARLTPGFNLPAKFVIHTVGPVYRDGRHGEPELLKKCYRSILRLATKEGIKSIAIPSISTGVYGYPVREAAQIAVSEVRDWLVRHQDMSVTFVCFNGPRDKVDVKAVYDKLLKVR